MEVKDAFKFCPRCSSQFKNEASYLKCPVCGLSYYLNPKPVQSVIIKNDKDEYLFVVRSIEPRKGYLDFPGGFVEVGENFEQTTRRELKEELGIEVGKLTYLSSHTDDYLYDGIKYKVIGVTYLAELLKGAELKPADDVSAIEWHKLDKIPTDRIAWSSMLEIISKLKSI